MEFTYSERYDEYGSILDKKVIDCLSKHVIRTNTDKSKRLVECSLKIYVPYVYWGYPDGLHEHPEMNRMIQIGCIQHGITTKNIKSMRVVVGNSGIPWIDNLHTAIQNIMIYGEDITIRQCRPYICDMTSEPFKIVSIDGSVASNIGTIKGAIQAGIKRMSRIHSDMYNIGYTIGDFLKENEINRDVLTINHKYINSYRGCRDGQ